MSVAIVRRPKPGTQDHKLMRMRNGYGPDIVPWPHIAGPDVLPQFEAKKLLGKSAHKVWVAMMHKRAPDGWTVITNRTLARQCKLPYRRVCSIACKLKRIGLLRFLGTKSRAEVIAHGVKITGRGRHFEVRQTMGDFREAITKWPRCSREAAVKARHGGARRGAGRPKSAKGRATALEYGQAPASIDEAVELAETLNSRALTMGKQQENLFSSPEDLRRKESHQVAVHFSDSDQEPKQMLHPDIEAELRQVFAEIQSTKAKANKVSKQELTQPDYEQLGSPDDNYGWDPAWDEPTSTPAAPAPTPSKKAASASVAPSSATLRPSPRPPVADAPRTTQGTTRVAPVKRDPFAGMLTMTIPPDPSPDRLRAPIVPAPNGLPGEVNNIADARLVMQVWNQCLTKNYGEPHWPYVEVLQKFDSEIPRTKGYLDLIACIRVMREFKIAPAAWAAFSIDVWKQYGDKGQRPGKTRPPPTNWVFAEKRIIERHGWFRREAGGYRGGKIAYTELHRDINRRYAALKRVVHVANIPIDAEDGQGRLCALIEEWFPGGWLDWYRRCVAVNEKDQAFLKEQVAKGEFIW